MRLLSALSNFEPIQIKAPAKPISSGVGTGKTRFDLQEHAAMVRDEVVARYAAGATVKELAAKFELHHGTIRALLDEAGVQIRTRRRLTDEQLARARSLYTAGHTTTEIGDSFGVYASTIGRALVRMGVTLRPASRRVVE